MCAGAVCPSSSTRFSNPAYERLSECCAERKQAKRLKENASVVTPEGKEVGRVDRVVIDPKTKEVSHVVVRKGFLFTEDKVLPMDLIARTTEDQVLLRPDAGDLEKLPTFEETHYVPVSDHERAGMPAGPVMPSMYWYPPYGAAGWGGYGLGYYGPGYTTRTEKNIPQGTVALAEGAKVISADGEHVGNVEHVLTGSQADRATHFVISQGLLMKSRKLIPTAWISDLQRDEVHLGVGSELLKSLRDYEPEKR